MDPPKDNRASRWTAESRPATGGGRRWTAARGPAAGDGRGSRASAVRRLGALGMWTLAAGAALPSAACFEREPPEVEGEAVFAAAATEATAPDSAAGAESPPSPGAGPDDVATGGEGSQEGAAPPSSLQPQGAGQDPPQTATDSLNAALRQLAQAQRLILSRLDSIEGGGAAPVPTADTATGVATLEEATDDVRNLGVKIFWALVILLVFHVLIRAVIWVLETLSERSVTRRLTFKWLIPITRMLLWAIAAYLIVLNVFRVDAQGLLAASAALGVAVGIAAQDLLKNVLGGLIVVFDQPFQVGDKIRVGRSYGEVVSIGLRSTRVVTADDDLVTIPNSQVVGEQVANSNAGQLNCQVATDLHLPGRVDERKARRIAYEAAVNSRYTYLGKPIVVLVQDDFRTTFVTRIRIRAYVLDPRFEFVFQSDVTERARAGFREAGLTPDRDWYPAVDPDGPAGSAGAGGE